MLALSRQLTVFNVWNASILWVSLVLSYSMLFIAMYYAMKNLVMHKCDHLHMLLDQFFWKIWTFWMTKYKVTGWLFLLILVLFMPFFLPAPGSLICLIFIFIFQFNQRACQWMCLFVFFLHINTSPTSLTHSLHIGYNNLKTSKTTVVFPGVHPSSY